MRPSRSPPSSPAGARCRATSSTTAAETVRSAYAEVLATAPGEIRADVERSVAAVDLQLDALEAADGDTAAVAGDAELRGRLTAPEYVQAAERVRDYIGEHCGIDTRGLGLTASCRRRGVASQVYRDIS